MKIRVIRAWIPLLLLSINAILPVHAKVTRTNIYLENLRELALKACLDINYEQLGVYKRSELNDHSYWTYDVALDHKTTLKGDSERYNFVKQNTENYYKENLPIKAESFPLPHGAIFARCMTFYKSDKLKQFLKKTLYDNSGDGYLTPVEKSRV